MEKKWDYGFVGSKSDRDAYVEVRGGEQSVIFNYRELVGEPETHGIQSQNYKYL